MLRLPVSRRDSVDLSQSTASAASRKFNPAFYVLPTNAQLRAQTFCFDASALRDTRTSIVSLTQRSCLETMSHYSEVNTTHQSFTRGDHVAVAASGYRRHALEGRAPTEGGAFVLPFPGAR
jgi:hypothetical protein